jgi:deoxycytidylate deaminase
MRNIWYNGPPRKFKDDDLDWSRPAKYNVILHAEQNAFINRIGKVTGGIMYVTGKPCKMCMLEIAGYELREVIYFPFKSGDRNSNFFSKDDEVVDELAKLGNVTLRKFEGNLSWKRDRIKLLENIGIFG